MINSGAEIEKSCKKLISLLFTFLVYIGLIVETAVAAPFQKGDVFAAVAAGRVQHYDANLNLIETLNTGGVGFNTGMAFDKDGNLYVTNFSVNSVSVFRAADGAFSGNFGSGYFANPESIVFDSDGNVYVGHAGGNRQIRKFDPSGNFSTAFFPAVEDRGTDWIDLAADQKTMFYTSEGTTIFRFDVSTGTQLPDFSNDLHRPAFALRILPDGGVLVADSVDIHRLDATGTIVQTYDAPGENCWFALNLDPDGTSFWSGDSCTANFYKFDIASGAVLASKNTGTGATTLFGLSVFGEITAAKRAATDVRVIDTVSTVNINLDSSSFSIPPFSVTPDLVNNRTIIEWQFPTFSIGQIENLSFDLILKNLVPGEDRLVNHKLEVLYTDINGNPVRTELGPQFVHVLTSAFSTDVTTDKTQYGANEDVLIDLAITNLSDFARTVDAMVDIEDSQGNLVQSVATLSALSFAAGESKTFLDLLYNTGTTFGGDYRVHARLIEAGKQVGESFTDFIILAVKQAASAIVADKITYSSNEPVTLTSTVTSESPNSSLTGLEVTVNVTDPSGVSIFSETRAIRDLLPEERFQLSSFTNTGIQPAGLYNVTLQVLSKGELLTSAANSFEIISSLLQAEALSGTVEVNPGSIFETETTTLTYTIRNTGNEIDLPLIEIEILIVDPDTTLPVRTITAETSLNGREVFADTILFDSTGLAPKSYLVVLRGITAGVTQTLDSAGLEIKEIPNNAPTADVGSDQLGFVDFLVTLDGTGSNDPDGDPLAFRWNFVSVPATSQITDASLTDATTPTPSFTPDVEGIYVVSLVVNDGLIDSPVDTVSIFVNPPPTVNIHPETINLKSNGGSRSITGVLSSPVLSSFEFFTAPDGVTVTASFTLKNSYIDQNGDTVVFTIPAEDYPGDDVVEAVDSDGDGDIDLYQLTLKFNRDDLIAGFTDANGELRITQATEVTSTVIGDGLAAGSDVNTVIAPPRVSKK